MPDAQPQSAAPDQAGEPPKKSAYRDRPDHMSQYWRARADAPSLVWQLFECRYSGSTPEARRVYGDSNGWRFGGWCSISSLLRTFHEWKPVEQHEPGPWQKMKPISIPTMFRLPTEPLNDLKAMGGYSQQIQAAQAAAQKPKLPDTPGLWHARHFDQRTGYSPFETFEAEVRGGELQLRVQCRRGADWYALEHWTAVGWTDWLEVFDPTRGVTRRERVVWEGPVRVEVPVAHEVSPWIEAAAREVERVLLNNDIIQTCAYGTNHAPGWFPEQTETWRLVAGIIAWEYIKEGDKVLEDLRRKNDDPLKLPRWLERMMGVMIALCSCCVTAALGYYVFHFAVEALHFGIEALARWKGGK